MLKEVNAFNEFGNYTVIKKYRDDYYTVTQLFRDVNKSKEEKIFSDKTVIKNDKKLSNHLSRAKNTIFELALCNDWKYFATLTINPHWNNNKECDLFYKKFNNYIRTLNTRKQVKIKYLIVPELHKSCAYHFHCLFNDDISSFLCSFDVTQKLPLYIKNGIKSGKNLLYFENYSKNFGYNVFEKINNIECVAGYLTKYISKSLGSAITEREKNLYYCSKGLKRAEILHQGEVMPEQIIKNADFYNSYVTKRSYSKLEHAIAFDVEYYSKSFKNSTLTDLQITKLINSY